MKPSTYSCLVDHSKENHTYAVTWRRDKWKPVARRRGRGGRRGRTNMAIRVQERQQWAKGDTEPGQTRLHKRSSRLRTSRTILGKMRQQTFVRLAATNCLIALSRRGISRRWAHTSTIFHATPNHYHNIAYNFPIPDKKRRKNNIQPFRTFTILLSSKITSREKRSLKKFNQTSKHYFKHLKMIWKYIKIPQVI